MSSRLYRVAKSLFEVSWRLTFLLLPLQTRWFVDASLGGWPWEQGRWSVYGTMLMMVMTIVLGWVSRIALPSTKSRHRWMDWRIGGIIIAVFGISLIVTGSLPATLQWWFEVSLLGAFVATLILQHLDRRALVAWFVSGVVAQAVLGIWQYFVGAVWASKWLGIAIHLPETLGTAVVEHGEFRLLRAYGGFPHPNIFGGWLAIGILLGLFLTTTATSRWRALAWSAALMLMSAALVVTYARGAWIATVVGVIVLLVGARAVRSVQSTDTLMRMDFSMQYFCLALFAALSIIGAVGYSQRAAIFARVDFSQRLEAKSLDVRRQSLDLAWSVFRRRPWFGAGPNAELVQTAVFCGQRCPAPLEPPHAVFLLFLADFGIVGTLACLVCVWRLRGMMTRTYLFPLGALFVVALFDHYPLSTWSGLCLSAVVIMFAWQRTQMPEEDSKA